MVIKRDLAIIIVFSALICGCKSTIEKNETDPRLKLISTYQLQIKQPSGITSNEDYTNYWIVDGDSQRIYKTDLAGNILERLAYKGYDLEGICYDKKSKTLWIIEERSRELIKLDIGGNELGRFQTNIVGSKNKGLEGIAIDDEQNIFVANEKSPKAIYFLGKNYNYSEKYDFPIAADISDLYYNPSNKCFFVLSDKSRSIYIWNTKEDVVDNLKLPFTKMEGITVNPLKNRIILVNDSLNTMYEYEFKN
jgi:uncharacterized protein YjiK